MENQAEEFLQAVGATLRDIRVAMGLTQTQLAKQANKKQAAIARIERDPPKDLALRVLYEICAGSKINLLELIKLAGHRSHNEWTLQSHEASATTSIEPSDTIQQSKVWLGIEALVRRKSVAEQELLAAVLKAAIKLLDHR